MRRATSADCGFFLALRNDPSARQWARSPEPISDAEHVAWYTAALQTEALFVEEGVGTVRIAADGAVSLIVRDAWRGAGYGRMLLRRAMELAGRPRYCAWSHRDHPASLITFLRCGFRPRSIEAPWVELEWLRCPHCRAGAPFHTVGVHAIGDATRYRTEDLHEVSDHSGVGLAECEGR